MINYQESILPIIFLIVGIGVSILVLIFVSVLGGGVYTNAEPNINVLSGNVYNKSSGVISSVPYIYNSSSSYIWSGSESIYIWNATGYYGALVLGTNYTVLSYDTGQFTITSVGGRTLQKINISYTTGNPVIEGNITSAIKNSFTALNTTGSYTPIIVLAVIIFIILSMVMTLTPGMRRGYESSGAL
jgi:hypothetical protein